MHSWLSTIFRLLQARRLAYLDFIIEVRPQGSGQRYLSTVTSSRAEQGQGIFINPYEKRSWQGLSAREVGECLFRALFRSPKLRTLFDQSTGAANGRNCGLRLCLSFNASDPKVSARVLRIAHLPWELMYDPDRHIFLSLDQRYSVVRRLLAQSLAPSQEAPFRGYVLLAWAEPADRAPLNLREECARIFRACRSRRLQPEILEHATLEALREKLLEKDFSIVHFMGHGELQPDGNNGTLLFENKDRESDPVTGEVLAHLFADRQSLRLVVLNACDSGVPPSFDPMGGVATALIATGFPAALAMQSKFNDPAAIAFSGGFYRSLAAGVHLEQAATDGRLAVLSSSFREDWQVPVLYTQTVSTPPVIVNPRKNRLGQLLALVALAFLAITPVFLLLWRSSRPDASPVKPPSVDLECPKFRLVQTVDKVSGVGRDLARSYYLFIMDPNNTCWLQDPAPLLLDHQGTWDSAVQFSGAPGVTFTLIAISSHQPLSPDLLKQLGASDGFPCSLIPLETDRTTCSVRVGPAAE